MANGLLRPSLVQHEKHRTTQEFSLELVTLGRRNTCITTKLCSKKNHREPKGSYEGNILSQGAQRFLSREYLITGCTKVLIKGIYDHRVPKGSYQGNI